MVFGAGVAGEAVRVIPAQFRVVQYRRAQHQDRSHSQCDCFPGEFSRIPHSFPETRFGVGRT